MTNVFIDGKSGTTGLRIYDRLNQRDDVKLITLPEEKRHDLSCRKEALNSCDVAFLCLPDDAAREAVSLIENPAVRVLDTSTAHRTNPDWAYGFPELSKAHLTKILNSNRIAVPGCHAGGFIALVYPLIASGIIGADLPLSCHSITGYSGGGKKMIAQYEENGRSRLLDSPRQYGLSQQHKHLKEMKAVTGLEHEPIFCPIVSGFYSGMVMTVPVFASQLKKGSVSDIKNIYTSLYTGPIVRYTDSVDEDGLAAANALTGLDRMDITVAGNDERILLIARYDNLGKGASGAALECFNYITNNDPVKGLAL